jgi:hypothetical protein
MSAIYALQAAGVLALGAVPGYCGGEADFTVTGYAQSGWPHSLRFSDRISLLP